MGQVVEEFEMLPSTNQYAQELLSKSKPVEGTVISAQNQHAGRGQIGSSWEAAPGQNLTLSIILYPQFLAIQHQFQLNQSISLGVRDFIAKYVQKPVKIKWPNDIYVNDNKIAGILIQNTLAGQKISSSIIGIGININQKEFITNPPNPTSLALENNASFDLRLMQNALCECLEPRYLQLKSGRTGVLYQNYLTHLYRYKAWANFRRADESIFRGKITGISPLGKLRVESADGVEEFGVKEVGFVR